MLRIFVWFIFVLSYSISRTVFAQSCTTTLTSGANITTALNAVTSGGTVCLNAGTYPALSGPIVKTSMTTVTTAPGVIKSQVKIGWVNIGASKNITFKNLTIGGAEIGQPGGDASEHIYFTGNAFTAGLCIRAPKAINQDTLVDNNTFIDVGRACGEGRLTVSASNSSSTVAIGIVISNNLFKGNGGCSDGVQLSGPARGVIISGNEFTGIIQPGACPGFTADTSPHTDPIQFYGASQTQVLGNYFHDNSTGIMSSDCNGSGLRMINNVFSNDHNYPAQVTTSGANGDFFSHNTLLNGAQIRFGPGNCTTLCSGAHLENNIIPAGLYLDPPKVDKDGKVLAPAQKSDSFTIISNYGFGGTNPVTSLPTFAGGTNPTTWAGYAVTSNSIGSDGKKIGAEIGTPPSTSLPSSPSGLKLAN